MGEQKYIQEVKNAYNADVIIGAKDIIEQTKISDRTVRRILRKFVDNKTIKSIGNTEKIPNKKYKLAEY